MIDRRRAACERGRLFLNANMHSIKFLSCIDLLTDGRARDNMIALDIALAFRKSDTAPVMTPPKSSTLWQALYTESSYSK